MTNIEASPAPTSRNTGSDDSLAHGVHEQCQLGSPVFIALCGAEQDAHDLVDEYNDRDVCVVCLDYDHCPLCGWPIVWPHA